MRAIELLLWFTTATAGLALAWALNAASPAYGAPAARVRGVEMDSDEAVAQAELDASSERAPRPPEFRAGLPLVTLDRLTFPDYDPPELRAPESVPLPASEFPGPAQEFAGKEVAIEGFPLVVDFSAGEVRQLLLSRFPPGCCFGAVPVPDEWVQVHVSGGMPQIVSDKVVMTMRGTLEVGEVLYEDGAVDSLYRLRDAALLDSP